MRSLSNVRGTLRSGTLRSDLPALSGIPPSVLYSNTGTKIIGERSPRKRVNTSVGQPGVASKSISMNGRGISCMANGGEKTYEHYVSESAKARPPDAFKDLVPLMGVGIPRLH